MRQVQIIKSQGEKEYKKFFATHKPQVLKENKSQKNYTFKDLRVWQKAHELALGVYKATDKFPNFERFGLANQIQRSSVSVSTNIVEGYKRRSNKDFLHFLNIAESSLEETKYQLLLSYDLGYLDLNHFQDLSRLADDAGRMLCGFQNKLKSYNV